MSEFKEVKSSGIKDKFETGAWRDASESKGRWDLIPYWAMHKLAIHYQNGANVYGDRNWEKGIPLYRYLDSSCRHLYKLIGNESSEDHCSAVIWNMMAYSHSMELIKLGILPRALLNERPDNFTPNQLVDAKSALEQIASGCPNSKELAQVTLSNIEKASCKP